MHIRSVVISLGIVTALLASGCATTVSVHPEKLATHPAGNTGGDSAGQKHPGKMFQRAVAAYRAGEITTARDMFTGLVKQHPKTNWGERSLYNLGVIYRAQAQWALAADYFERFLKCCTTDSRDRMDTALYLMECCEHLGQWQKILLYAKMVEKNGHETGEEIRLELLVRQGRALFELNLMDRAEYLLLQGANLYNRARNKGGYLDPYFGAAVHFLRGMIRVKRFDNTAFVSNTEEEALESLNTKAQHLLDAQQLFLLCIMEGQAELAAAAGFEIGRMYEEFYRHIMDRPVPKYAATDKDSEIVYQCMVREFLVGMVKKALRFYKQVVNMGQRTGLKSLWMEKTQRHLENLQARYDHETAICAPYRKGYKKVLDRHMEKLKQKK